MNPMPSLNPQPAPRPNAPGVRSNRPPSIPRLPLEEPVRVDLDEFGLPLEVSAEHPAPVKAAEPAASPAVSADTTAIAEPAPGAEIAEFEAPPAPPTPAQPSLQPVQALPPEPESEPKHEPTSLMEELAQAAPRLQAPLNEEIIESPSLPLPAFTLESLLHKVADLPGNLAVLGMGSDELPLILDLDDPQPGSLLCACDDPGMRQRFLRTLVHSAAMLNPIRNFQFLVLTRQPAEWQPLLHTEPFAAHCLAVESLPEPADLLPSAANRWLIKLASLAERRRSLSVQGPALLVIFDDLSAVSALSSEARQDLEWLIREGPLVRVRLAAALALSEAENLARWVRPFSTRLVGSAGGALAATPLLGDRFLRLKPGQYAVRVREEWLRFQAPSLPDEA